MTLVGLSTVNLSQLNTFQQALLLLLIMLGSTILVSSTVIYVRRKAFEYRFKHIIEVERQKRRAWRSLELSQSHQLHRFEKRTRPELHREIDASNVLGTTCSSPGHESGRTFSGNHFLPMFSFQLSSNDMQMENTTLQIEHITGDLESEALSNIKNRSEGGAEIPETSHASSSLRFVTRIPPSTAQSHIASHTLSDIQASLVASNVLENTNSTAFRNSQIALDAEIEQLDHKTYKYFKSGGTIGRNSQFHNLTAGERERLGGVEFRAITLLEIIVPFYFVFWQLIGAIALGAWISSNAADTTLQNGLNPWYDSLCLLDERHFNRSVGGLELSTPCPHSTILA